MNCVIPNFENLNTRDEVVAKLKNELSEMIGNIRCDRIIGRDCENPVNYEVDRAVAYYVASLIYRLTGDEEYKWEDNSSYIYSLDAELHFYREQRSELTYDA